MDHLMVTRIDVTTLTDELAEILETVRRTGEQYDIERDGEVIASITPASPAKRATMRDLARILENTPWPDDQFADDLEAIRRSQQPMGRIPWDT